MSSLNLVNGFGRFFLDIKGQTQIRDIKFYNSYVNVRKLILCSRKHESEMEINGSIKVDVGQVTWLYARMVVRLLITYLCAKNKYLQPNKFKP